MFKKIPFAAIVIFIFTTFANNVATAEDFSVICWTNGTGDRHWAEASNWDLGYVPSWIPGVTQNDAAIVKTGTEGPIFDVADGPQSCWLLIIGRNGVAGEMWMNGGIFTAPWGLCFNKGGPGNSTLHMSGGTLYLKGAVNGGILQIGRGSVSTFNMSGGNVECVSISIPYTPTSGSGVLNLDGGTVSGDTLTLVTSGLINITKGKLILTGDQVSQINGYINSNLIVPYPGQTVHKIVNVDYDIRNTGKTTVTASKTELTQAWNPVPMDAHPSVDKSTALCWNPGDGAISHNLYVGNNFNDVNDGTEPLVTTDVNSFTNGFVCGQTYYWRVDEYDGTNTYKGQVWQFTTAFNPQASSPNPVDGAIAVEPGANLGWTPGDTATAHDVYFGTSFADVNSANNYSIPPGRGRQTATSYEPGTLTLGRKYYWRIDEFDGSTAQRGNVWSFEVVSGIASQPQPTDGKRFVGDDVILRWSAGYAALSHGIYLGTNFSDVNDASVPLTTVTTTDYAPMGLELGRTYYWRIDENDGVTHKGQVWQFTTEPAGSVRAFPGAEGYGAYSLGGRGGDVYHVTNLTDDATSPLPGSLRYGIDTATGPRTIVFDVCGYIELQNRLEITKPYITIAGQTAPGNGITLRKHDMRVYNTHDVIIRYIRERMGYYSSGQVTGPGGMDALSVERSSDVIMDHISASWSRDELMSVTGDSNDITLQWCMLTEPLNIDEHSKASLLRPAMTSRLTHHHNLYADIMKRVTRFGNYNDDVVTRFDWYNNVVFNWGPESTYSNDNDYVWLDDQRVNGTSGADGEFVEINFLDNYFIAGPTTSWFKAYQGTNPDNHKIWAKGILTDFDLDPNHNGVDTGWGDIGGNYMKMSGEFSIESPYTFENAATAYEKVLARAGASLVRDAVDERIISDVNSRVGSIPNTQDDVGGWPVIAEVNRPADFDTDGDGMPNAYEITRGLDPNDPSDRNVVGDDGYPNLEKYLNYLVLWRGDLKGDFNNDEKVNWVDLAVFMDDWLIYDPTFVPAGDLNGDNYVNWYDFAIFAQNCDP